MRSGCSKSHLMRPLMILSQTQYVTGCGKQQEEDTKRAALVKVVLERAAQREDSWVKAATKKAAQGRAAHIVAAIEAGLRRAPWDKHPESKKMRLGPSISHELLNKGSAEDPEQLKQLQPI